MIRDSNPIPRIDKSIDGLCSAEVFSTFDADSGYWHIELDQAYLGKSAFVTYSRLYLYTRMPFALKNAPVKFRHATDMILALVK